MKSRETGIFAAKTHFSELVQKVQEEGVTYCITKRGKPVAELRPVGTGPGTMGELIESLKGLEADPGFAEDLRRANQSDSQMEDPWG